MILYGRTRQVVEQQKGDALDRSILLRSPSSRLAFFLRQRPQHRKPPFLSGLSFRGRQVSRSEDPTEGSKMVAGG